ncbi:MAG: ABC transporter substrate-binding protein [Nitrospinota bacterium]
MRRAGFPATLASVFAFCLPWFFPFQGAHAQTRLNFTQGPEPKSLDLALHPNGSIDITAQVPIYDALLSQGVNGEIHPALATSWAFKNPTTVVFKLRQGVRFHDGTPFNAAAVKFNLERTLNHKRSRLNEYIRMIKEVRVLSDSEVEIELKFAFASFLSHLAHTVASFGSPEAIQKHGEEFGRNPVGAGPFVFKEWVSGEYIKYAANPGYWGGRPAIDELVYRVVPEATTRVLQLRAGQLQLGCFLPPAQQNEVRNDPGLSLVKSPLFRTIFIGMNNQVKPFDNRLVRQAMNHAVDTKTIIEKVMLGSGTPLGGPFGPTVWGYDPEFEKMGYRYDPERAKQLLKEAGFPNGFEVEFWHPTGRYTDDKLAAEAIQDYLAKVGVRAKLKTGNWSLIAPAVRNGKAPMYFYGWGVVTGDADMALYYKFHSSMWGPPGNYDRYKNPQVDKRLDEARQEIDAAKRKAIYKEVAKQVVEDAPWVFFKQEEMLCGQSKKLSGVVYHPSQSLFFHKARLAP